MNPYKKKKKKRNLMNRKRLKEPRHQTVDRNYIPLRISNNEVYNEDKERKKRKTISEMYTQYGEHEPGVKNLYEIINRSEKRGTKR